MCNSHPGMVAGESLKAAEKIQQRICEILRWAQGCHNKSKRDWASKVMDELTGIDFSLLRNDWLQDEFRFVFGIGSRVLLLTKCNCTGQMAIPSVHA